MQQDDEQVMHVAVDGDHIAYATRDGDTVTYHLNGRAPEIVHLDSWIMKLYEDYRATRDAFAELAEQPRVNWHATLDEWADLADQAETATSGPAHWRRQYLADLEWQRQLAVSYWHDDQPFFLAQRARKSGLSTAFERAHINGLNWRSADEVTRFAERTDWERQLDAVRADHDGQHQRLWSEHDLEIDQHAEGGP